MKPIRRDHPTLQYLVVDTNAPTPPGGGTWWHLVVSLPRFNTVVDLAKIALEKANGAFYATGDRVGNLDSVRLPRTVVSELHAMARTIAEGSTEITRTDLGHVPTRGWVIAKTLKGTE